MELNDELKLLLIKTEAHKNEAAATGVFNTIRDLEDIDENYAYKDRLEMFYSKHRDLGTTDSDGVWTEPTEAELAAALSENEYVNPVVAEIWELEKYESEAAYNANQYSRDRKAAYPPLEDQLDNIYHNGVDAWKADIQAIKDAHPKP